MIDDIDARFERECGRLSLICGDASFARLLDLVRAEAPVGDVVNAPVESIRIIHFRSTALADDGPRWLARIPQGISLIILIAGLALSSFVHIIGLVAIVRWVGRQFT
jgi:hypothetical protein